jgi:hypothetical protein
MSAKELTGLWVLQAVQKAVVSRCAIRVGHTRPLSSPSPLDSLAVYIV